MYVFGSYFRMLAVILVSDFSWIGTQNSGAVGKSRWPSGADQPTETVGVKQHSTNQRPVSQAHKVTSERTIHS